MSTMGPNPWDLYYRRHPVDWKGTGLPILEPGSRVLDVGCGTGSTLLGALERGFSATGIDLSREAVSRTRKRLARRGLEADVRMMDVRSDLCELGEFDCILLHFVLGSMLRRDRISAVHNCRKLLRKGGTLSFMDLSSDDVRFGRGEPLEEERTFVKKDGIISHFFTLEETRELFHGLEEKELGVMEWEQGSGRNRIRRSRTIGVFRA